jgi:cytochrome P450
MTNLQALHTDPQSWGSDSLTFRPSRWLLSTVENGASAAMETFIEPPAGAFVPWADGPRVCPGRKLAQVEFIAVMVALFRKHRVQPLLKEGEKMDSGLHRLRGIVNDSGISAITVQMRRPRDAALTWTRVEV